MLPESGKIVKLLIFYIYEGPVLAWETSNSGSAGVRADDTLKMKCEVRGLCVTSCQTIQQETWTVGLQELARCKGTGRSDFYNVS